MFGFNTKKPVQQNPFHKVPDVEKNKIFNQETSDKMKLWSKKAILIIALAGAAVGACFACPPLFLSLHAGASYAPLQSVLIGTIVVGTLEGLYAILKSKKAPEYVAETVVVLAVLAVGLSMGLHFGYNSTLVNIVAGLTPLILNISRRVYNKNKEDEEKERIHATIDAECESSRQSVNEI